MDGQADKNLKIGVKGKDELKIQPSWRHYQSMFKVVAAKPKDCKRIHKCKQNII